MYIFTIKERILGTCDEENLKESAEKIWNKSCNNGEENDVVIYYVEQNTVDYESPFATFYFDKYDDDTKLGLRLIGLGGAIDKPLEIEV